MANKEKKRHQLMKEKEKLRRIVHPGTELQSSLDSSPDHISKEKEIRCDP